MALASGRTRVGERTDETNEESEGEVAATENRHPGTHTATLARPAANPPAVCPPYSDVTARTRTSPPKAIDKATPIGDITNATAAEA